MAPASQVQCPLPLVGGLFIAGPGTHYRVYRAYTLNPQPLNPKPETLNL